MSSRLKQSKNLTSEHEVDNEDRRNGCPSTHALWAQLSIAQQASVSSMHNYGYELSFIRTEGEEIQVVMLLNETLVVIDDEGTIDTQANIKIRHKE